MKELSRATEAQETTTVARGWAIHSPCSVRPHMADIVTKRLSQPQWSRGYHTRLWIRGSRVRWIFFSERKNPEYDFLRKGSKAVGPVS